MIVAIADTHTTIWYLYSDSRLGKAASNFIDRTISQGDHIGVSAITVAEIIYLVEKSRIPTSAVRDLQDAHRPHTGVVGHILLMRVFERGVTDRANQWRRTQTFAPAKSNAPKLSDGVSLKCGLNLEQLPFF